MNRRWKNSLRGAALIVAGFATGSAASAQLFFTNPDFRSAPIDAGDPLVGIPVPGATPAEQRAHLLWNLRAGLNVAALQCQFSPYLRTVDNYNSILAHHSAELASAYTTLNAYFKRVHGKDGQKRFDDYTTMTYNNFSTLQAQYGFCQTASSIGKEALTRPKGQFHVTAQNRMREFRNSLVPAYDRPVVAYNPNLVQMPVMPDLSPLLGPECYDKKKRLRKKCGGTA